MAKFSIVGCATAPATHPPNARPAWSAAANAGLWSGRRNSPPF